MAKRYLGGGVSFEQKDVYQEFSEDEGGGGGGSSALSGLTDVDISNPSDGQTLVYNATSGKWENGAGGGSGLVVTVTPHNWGQTNEYADLDKTGGEIVTALNSGRNVVFRMADPGVLNENFSFGDLIAYESFIPEGMTVPAYTFTFGKTGGDFYTGTYGCYGADGYPSTHPPEG